MTYRMSVFQKFDLGRTTLCGDVRINAFGRKSLRPEDDLRRVRKREEQQRQAAGKHIRAGKETGCLFHFIFNTAFLSGEEFCVKASMIDNPSKKRGNTFNID